MAPARRGGGLRALCAALGLSAPAWSRRLGEESRLGEGADLERHYRRDDAHLHSQASFQTLYGHIGKADAEWQATPAEQRVAKDNKAYTLQGFRDYYPSDWVARWKEANIATQMRIAHDKQNYTIAEFKSFYTDMWPERWAEAKPVACQECCGGINHGDCDLRPKCMWKWDPIKKDWKTACVPLDMSSLERHYRRGDAKLHTKDKFTDAEWQATPAEQRVAKDNKAYTLQGFRDYYPNDWVARWKEANIATQMRTAHDKQNYTIAEFKSFYTDMWPERWAEAKPVACQECCGGINHADCDLRPKCMWKWDPIKKDWKTACVPVALHALEF